jgi:hypothetical protein
VQDTEEPVGFSPQHLRKHHLRPVVEGIPEREFRNGMPRCSAVRDRTEECIAACAAPVACVCETRCICAGFFSNRDSDAIHSFYRTECPGLLPEIPSVGGIGNENGGQCDILPPPGELYKEMEERYVSVPPVYGNRDMVVPAESPVRPYRPFCLRLKISDKVFPAEVQPRVRLVEEFFP